MTEIAGVHGPEYGDIGINADGDHVVYARADGAGGIVAYGPIPNTYPAGLTGDKTIVCRVMVPEAGYVKFFEVANLRLSMIPFGSGWKPTAYVVTPEGDSTVTGDEIALSSSTAVDLAATYDASTGTLDLFVDNVSVNSSSFGEARDTQIGLPIWQAGAAPGGWVGFAGLFDEVLIFATNPTVTIDQGSGQSDPTAVASIVFDVVFSEAVTGFATGDVTLSGTAGATTGTVVNSGDDIHYTVTVTGMTSSGTVIASIGSAVCTSIATGLPNDASTSSDNQVTLSILLTQEIADNFNRANGGLGGNWSSSSPWTVTSNQARKASTTNPGAIMYSATAVSQDDMYVQATYVANWTTTTSSPLGYVILRANSAGTQYYAGGWLRDSGATNGWTLRISRGGTSLVQDNTVTAPSPGDVVQLRIVGTTLTLFVNGVLKLTTTDANYSGATQRYAGMIATTNSTSVVFFDDWSAGKIT